MKRKHAAYAKLSKSKRAYPEDIKFEYFVPRILKLHTFVDLHTTKNAEDFNLTSSSLKGIAKQKYNNKSVLAKLLNVYDSMSSNLLL